MDTMVIIIIQLILYCALFTAMVKYAVRFGAVDGLLKKRGFLTLIWIVGSFIVAGIVVLIFGGFFV